MNRKVLVAGLYLAYTLVLHIFRRIKVRVLDGPDGYTQFMENFFQEGIWAFQPGERNAYAKFSTCINCGICLFRAKSPEGDPRLFALSYYRDLSRGGEGTLMDRDEGDRTVEMCPTRVPLRKMLEFMEIKK